MCPSCIAGTLLGAVVNGSLSGGEPISKVINSVNYFDPGRVLLRPADFMSIQVLNENGNADIVVDGHAIEFGAFVGDRTFQLAQFADFNDTTITVRYAHSGTRTCMQAATFTFESLSFAALKRPPIKLLDEINRAVDAKGRVAVRLVGNVLTLWVPKLCLGGAANETKVIVGLV